MIILNETNFDQIISKGVTLVDFFATWCAPCRMQAPVLEDIENHYKENSKVKVCKLDVDEDGEVAMKYGVMNIPTLIIFKNGEISAKFIGLTDFDEIIAKIEEAL